MKKLIYLFTAFSFLLTSCDPMDDVHEEIRADLNDEIVGNVDYIMTEDDYTDNQGLNLDDAYFSSYDNALHLIPEFLSMEFPGWDSGIANVTFDYVQYDEQYIVTDQDYIDAGESYPNFNSDDDIYNFLASRFGDVEEGYKIFLIYDYYSGGVNTRADIYEYGNGSWSRVREYYVFNSDDYTAMEQNFPNFSTHETALQNIPIYLKNGLFPYAEAGEVKHVLYERFVSGPDPNEWVPVSYRFDGGSWIMFGLGNIISETVQFGLVDGVWEPDNTIIYTLTPNDFDLISEALSDVEGYEGPAWSAGNYNNFDRRPGNQNYWSDEMLLVAINIVLNNINPDAEEGQKYIVRFAIYNGAAGVESMSVIKQEGEWVLNE